MFFLLSEFVDKAVVKATANRFLQTILFRVWSQLYNEESNWIRNPKYLEYILSLPIFYCNYTFHALSSGVILACLSHYTDDWPPLGPLLKGSILQLKQRGPFWVWIERHWQEMWQSGWWRWADECMHKTKATTQGGEEGDPGWKSENKCHFIRLGRIEHCVSSRTPELNQLI